MTIKEAVLAFDLGGTKLHGALVGPGGEIIAEKKVPTEKTEVALLQSFRDGAKHLLDRVESGTRVVATGVGTAGVIKPEGGLIKYAPNLPFNNFALGDFLTGFCPGPAVVLNDGRAAAMGEYAFGELAGCDPMVCLFYGTGIGIGIVVDGRILTGHDNYAGEIGHTIFNPRGPVCNCGKPGCCEALCGGGPMTGRAEREISPDHQGKKWTVGDIVSLGAGGDDRAQAILADATDAFQVLTANVVTLFNPGALVLGGGVMKGWPDLEGIIAAGIERFVHPAVRENLRVGRSALDSQAILLGAAAAALQAGHQEH